jgi:hypothetical protein
MYILKYTFTKILRDNLIEISCLFLYFTCHKNIKVVYILNRILLVSSDRNPTQLLYTENLVKDDLPPVTEEGVSNV